MDKENVGDQCDIERDWMWKLPQPYLADRFSDQAAHHHALRVDEQVRFGLRGSAQGHLLETQLAIRYAAHVLSLETSTRCEEGGTSLKKKNSHCVKPAKVQSFTHLFNGVFGIVWHDEEDFSIPELGHHPLLLPALETHQREDTAATSK